MSEALADGYTRTVRWASLIGRFAAWAMIAGLGLLIAAHMLFFVVHAAQLLSYPYPLDYGEGPLLIQVELLRSGTPFWRLYADPTAPPYAVVNYPPIYHLITALVSLATGSALLAGRIVSLVSALGAVVAIWLLSDQRPTTNDEGWTTHHASRITHHASRSLVVLAFLALPIVREWSVVMRVDMLGVCLGLWGLVIVQRNLGGSRALWAALPLALSLLVKPSLIAAPAAALLWLLFRDWRRALSLGMLLAIGGGLVVVLLQLASRGWFTLHVLAANVNEWQEKLAYTFWHDQMVIHWSLVVAAALSALGQIVLRPRTNDRRRTENREPPRGETPEGSTENNGPRTTDHGPRTAALLPLYYTLFGAIIAFGVGKVGAYANYFLEFYAGLIWLAASAIFDLQPGRWRTQSPISNLQSRPSSVAKGPISVVVVLLVAGALLRYYPTWSANYLKLAGIIEGSNPPRMVVGGYAVWADLRRERDILATMARVNAALIEEARAAGAPMFTDVPGVAAQAGQLARHQAFEHRQLFDAGLAQQRTLLLELANGQLPLAVLDYLGNWLTPEMIALLKHRYAQDGSRGTYDLYRPVEPGPLRPIDLSFPGGPGLVGYHLAPSPGRPAYHGGEIVLLTLEWHHDREEQPADDQASYTVVVQVTDPQGHTLLETTRPLLYGALAPSEWGNSVVQHMQPIALPLEIPAMAYQIAVTLRSGERDLAPVRAIAPLVVEEQTGWMLGEGGYYVPAPLLAAWQQAGGDEGPGDPLMPATPFHDYTLQCFVRACLRLERGETRWLPLGELIHLGDVGLAEAPALEGPAQSFADTGHSLRGAFLDYWQTYGGLDTLGPPITPQLIRGDRIVQYTRYARLERPIGGGAVRQGRLGEEFLRLPGGVAYRWP